MKRKNTFLLAIMLVGFWLSNACSKSSSSTSSNVKYFPTVKAIIQKNCLTCHSSSGTWFGRPIAFDSDSAISALHILIKESVAGPFSTNFSDNGIQKMPEEGTLPQNEIDTIVAWYNKGGKTTD